MYGHGHMHLHESMHVYKKNIMAESDIKTSTCTCTINISVNYCHLLLLYYFLLFTSRRRRQRRRSTKPARVFLRKETRHCDDAWATLHDAEAAARIVRYRKRSVRTSHAVYAHSCTVRTYSQNLRTKCSTNLEDQLRYVSGPWQSRLQSSIYQTSKCSSAPLRRLLTPRALAASSTGHWRQWVVENLRLLRDETRSREWRELMGRDLQTNFLPKTC